MKFSPLSLEQYFFTRIHVDAVQTTDKQGPPTFASRVDCVCHKDDPRRWMVTLKIRQNEDHEKKPTQYKIDIEIIGLFNVDKVVPDAHVAPFVRANGPAVLYGSVREIVALLTAQGPHPTVKLPSVTFVDEAQPQPIPTEKPRQPPIKSTPAK